MLKNRGKKSDLIYGRLLNEAWRIGRQQAMGGHDINLIGSSLLQDLCWCHKVFYIINDVILDEGLKQIHYTFTYTRMDPNYIQTCLRIQDFFCVCSQHLDICTKIWCTIILDVTSVFNRVWINLVFCNTMPFTSSSMVMITIWETAEGQATNNMPYLISAHSNSTKNINAWKTGLPALSHTPPSCDL